MSTTEQFTFLLLRAILFLPLFLLLHSNLSYAQDNNVHDLKGKVLNQATGEPLTFVNIYLKNDKRKGTISDKNGDFQLLNASPNEEEKIVLFFSFVGYKTHKIVLEYPYQLPAEIALQTDSEKLKEVTIKAKRKRGEELVESTEMSTFKLESKVLHELPSITGETDVIKVLQLMPGVVRGIEGTSDFFVRGGDADQNLVLLDNATVYNTGHLFGFMSVFNPHIIDEISMIKGGFPTRMGGRLSSVIEVKSYEKFDDSTRIKGSVGTLSAGLAWKQPIIKEKLQIMIGMRRTYIDRVLKILSSNPANQLPYYFYDFNGKIQYKINNKNTITLSNYLATDVLDFRDRFSDAGNNNRSASSTGYTIEGNSQTINWKFWSKKNHFLNIYLNRTGFSYNFNVGIDFDSDKNFIEVVSKLEDYGAKLELSKDLNPRTSYTVGTQHIYHQLNPSNLRSQGFIANILPTDKTPPLDILENAVFGMVDYDATKKWKISLGLRHSFTTGKFNHHITEPRIAIRNKLSEEDALKFSYSRMSQFMHRVSSSNVSLPVDIWFTVTDKILPQTSDQITFGYIKNLPSIGAYFETEVYYKNMNNLTEYEAGTNLVFNPAFEKSLIQGKGIAFGWEVLLKKEGEKLNGWISYTLARSTRFFSKFNQGNPFPARYDRRHNFVIVGSYKLFPRVNISMVWEYISGSRFTATVGQYAVPNSSNTGMEIQNIFTSRNQISLSASHRLDISISLEGRAKKIKSKWQLSFYNVYNNNNPISLSIGKDPEGRFVYKENGLFGFIPTITYKFEF